MQRRAYFSYVQGAHLPARRRARRHRLLRRPRHLGRGRVDARQGRRALHLHRRHRPVRRARHRLGARPRHGVRRRDRPPGRLPRGAGRGGPGRAGLRRVPHPLRRARLLQHHPARPGRHRHPAGAGDARGRRPDLGRRLDVQGQRHRAVLPLRPAGQPAPADLQAVAGRGLRLRARRPQGDVGVAARPRPALPGQHREGLLHRRQHLGRHPRGEDAGAPRHRHRDRRPDHGRAVLGPVGRDRRRGRHDRLRAGPPGDDQRQGVRLRRSTWCWRRTRSAAGTAWACRTRSRTGSSRPRAAASTRRPGMALLHAAYERLVNAIHNEDTAGELPQRGPAARPADVRGPLAGPAGADAARVAAALGRHGGHRRGDAAAAARRGLLDPRHHRPGAQLPPGQAVDGAHRGLRVRPGGPDRPADHAQPRHRRLARQARAVRRPRHGRQPRTRRSSAPPRRPRPADRRDARRAAPRPSPPAARSPTTTSCSTAPRWSPAPTDPLRLLATPMERLGWPPKSVATHRLGSAAVRRRSRG